MPGGTGAGCTNGILKERTRLDRIFLRQFRIFGHTARSDLALFMKVMEHDEIQNNRDYWILRRFLKIGYYAFVEFPQVNPTPESMSRACE